MNVLTKINRKTLLICFIYRRNEFYAEKRFVIFQLLTEYDAGRSSLSITVIPTKKN